MPAITDALFPADAKGAFPFFASPPAKTIHLVVSPSFFAHREKKMSNFGEKKMKNCGPVVYRRDGDFRGETRGCKCKVWRTVRERSRDYERIMRLLESETECQIASVRGVCLGERM